MFLLFKFTICVLKMDRSLLSTFLEIMSAGSLLAAAERLHISQTAVTARLHSLEEQLGCRLFVRNRSGARLTPEGERFAPHARQLLIHWEQAQQALRDVDVERPRLAVGAETSLWNPLLSRWLAWMNRQPSACRLDARVDEAERLGEAVQQRQLDAALVHLPRYHSALQVELLLEETLLLVETPHRDGPLYLVDWGPGFAEQFEASLPHEREGASHCTLGPLALRAMLDGGGRGYFRQRVVAPYLHSGELHTVAGAPQFSYPIYLQYRREDDRPLLNEALAGLRQLAAEDAQWQL
tara:strand:+ start:42463 stop:43347 length:885 start_codon:yes stop_codon:yes gene_type:complete